MSARARQPKNKSAAQVQITAEQILREAYDRQEQAPKPPTQTIVDHEELEDYRLRKRKEFEDAIRKNPSSINSYSKYAKWEESQHDLVRARSVYERALEVDMTHTGVWLKYVEMEIRDKNINSARNLFDRMVTLLPRVDQFWFKYIHMEDMLGNYAGARQIYERWMSWSPPELCWQAYIKWELRNGETDRVRDIYRRYVVSHPKPDTYLKWAKFEETQQSNNNARDVFEAALQNLEEEAHKDTLFIAFAQFEERCKEFERARAIYKFALDHLPKASAREVYKMFIQFEKKFGTREGIEDVILNKRRFQYEEDVIANPNSYDLWFDFIRLEEANGELNRIRDVYERAIANVPPPTEKRLWKRYVYLWINYAVFEELDAKDIPRAREVYKAIIELIPHKRFSFAKLWSLFANFELRQRNLDAARKVFGSAIGMAPSNKIYQAYIEMEMQLGNIDRARMLFQKWIQWMPENVAAWKEFAALEQKLNEAERCRAIFELAIAQPHLDMPEQLWKSYIDFEIDQQEYNNVRSLYQKLLQRTQHVKVWVSYAQFESSVGKVKEAREVFSKAFNVLKQEEKKEERVVLVESWVNFEVEFGDEKSQQEVMDKMPRRVTKRRKVITETGQEAGWEEYYDYIFPDEEAAKPNLKLLEAARKWKQQQAAASSQ